MDKDEALGVKKPITGIKFPTDKTHKVRDRVDKDEALSAKKLITGIRFPTDRAHKVRNRVNKDKVLGAKKPIIFKGAVKKYLFGFNPFGYLQGKGFKTKERVLILYY